MVEWLKSVISDPGIISAIKVTFTMAVCSTAISSVLGIVLGLLLERFQFPGKKIVVRINRTLMGVPPVVVGLVVYLLIMRRGPLGPLSLLFTIKGMVIAQTLIITPIICGMIYSYARKTAPSIRVFAVTMGADRWQTAKLTVREMKKEIYFCMVTGFGRSISEVGAVMLVGAYSRKEWRLESCFWSWHSYCSGYAIYSRKRRRRMKITNLEKTIGNFHLEVDDLYIEPGKIHGIVGPNGCGKTVFLKMVAKILKPDGGSIDYEGLTGRDITMMSQRPYLMDASVYQNLIYPLTLRGIRPDEDAVDQMLERAGLLSQKKQKLSFLRALIFHPKLIMVDETLSNLDPESEALFEGMIVEVQKEAPITWMIVNHQLDHIYQLCDQIHYMEKGRFVKS